MGWPNSGPQMQHSNYMPLSATNKVSRLRGLDINGWLLWALASPVHVRNYGQNSFFSFLADGPQKFSTTSDKKKIGGERMKKLKKRTLLY